MKFVTKILSNSKFKHCLLLILLLFMYITISAFSYTKAVCTDISNSVFRLHVIANSDSDEDQALKLIVRDSILEYMESISASNTSKEDFIELTRENLSQLQELAQSVVYDQGYTYKVSVEIGNFSFPTKKYGDITFPPGYYDALRIKIGEASGQNWWCVMFPPLCFVDTTSGIVPDESKKSLKNNLTDDEYLLISESSNSNYDFKFKIVEVLQNLTISGIFM